jgi:acyl-CoA synthetase (AMP-forming)/AMP-acid ligase II
MANNLADKFEAMVDAAPQRIALIEGERQVTFAELETQANRLAHHLAAVGVVKGDRVGLVARNSVAFVVAFIAAFKLRAVPVNVNYRYVAAELAELFEDSGVVALVVDEDLVDECARAVAGDDEPHHVVVIGETVGALGNRATTFAEAVDGSPSQRDFEPRSADDLHFIYTGGTTGRPKGVVWRQEDTYFVSTQGRGNDEALAEARANGDIEPTVALPAGPFIHSSSQWVLIAGLLAGRTTVILDRFDADSVWSLCRRHGVGLLSINGDAMARPLLDALGEGVAGPESVGVVYSSGGGLSPSTKKELAAAFPHAMVIDAIGASETGLLGMSPVTGDEQPLELTIPANADTMVVDEAGRPLGVGETGMLAKAGHVPLRYHNDPARSALAFIKYAGRRFAIPGDVARAEQDGTITVLGRQSSCINTGGEKVYPNEVEGVLMAHSAVADCVVVGVPDDRWGQRVSAIVELRVGFSVGLMELQEHARDTLAGYKIPRSLCRVEHIVRQPSGKADYRWALETASDQCESQ